MSEKPKEYKVSPMEVHVKFCVDERVVSINNQLTYQKWVYEQSDFPCPQCGKTTDVLFMRLPLGVFRTCSWDGFTERITPTHSETGEQIAYLAEQRVISTEEAWEVMERNKSTVPPFLPPWIPPRTRRGKKPKPPPIPPEA
jgi:predicted RNA-binding Zn-ribbon protein involved in translation (DUF1610 family)